MSETNENNLVESLRLVAELAEETSDPRCPSVKLASMNTPSMLLDTDGVPILLDGKAVDFGHLVELSQVVHPATIEVSTLQAVVDYFASGNLPGKECYVRIAHPQLVVIEALRVAADGVRGQSLRATWAPNVNRFDEWLPVDEFSTWLLSEVVPSTAPGGDGVTENESPTGDIEALYAAVGQGVKYEATREAADGSGGVEIKTSEGVNVEWAGGVGPRFLLRYICTFPEVSQPERACVFRARNHDDGIQVKLVDADGGAWRVKAIASIAEWLRANHELDGVTILG